MKAAMIVVAFWTVVVFYGAVVIPLLMVLDPVSRRTFVNIFHAEPIAPFSGGEYRGS